MEPKKEISSLDLRFLVRELRRELAGGVFRKVYQYGNKEKRFMFGVFVPGKGDRLLYVDGTKMFLAGEKKATPQEPPSFCMFLRKHIMGKRIRDIVQHGFDRIVEIVLDDCIIIFEMLHPGNVILADSYYNTIMPLEIQRWKSREVRPKMPYKYPPSGADPFNVKYDMFFRALKSKQDSLGAFLAAGLGFGSVYANEVCARAGISSQTICNEITQSEAAVIYDTIQKLGKEPASPCLYDGFVSPLELKVLGPPRERVQVFSMALEQYFSAMEPAEKPEAAVQKEAEKVERIIEQHKEAQEKWAEKQEVSKVTADEVFTRMNDIQVILEGIRKAREMGMPWSEIKQRLSADDSEQARMVREIREKEGKIILDVNGKEIQVDITKTAAENAGEMYDRSKQARAKVERIEESMKKQEEKLEGLGELKAEDFKKVEGEAEEEVAEKPGRKQEWYEKFRWFFSSEGMLVIAGRSAEQNEMIIKKYTDQTDLVYHADIQGAAFVVIKSMGMEITDQTRKEASEFAAANCKAWSRGLGTVDIFEVRPEQVSKSPPSGMSLGKGSFMVNGERVWYRNIELKLSIGVRIDREGEQAQVVAGPVLAVRKNSDYFVTVKPGFKKDVELARSIKNKLLIKARPEDKFFIEKIELDELQKHIPSGTGDVVEIAE